jgi:uncharacterized protein (DUF1778 family)
MGEKKTKNLNIRLTETELDEIQSGAVASGMNVSEYVLYKVREKGSSYEPVIDAMNTGFDKLGDKLDTIGSKIDGLKR